MKTFQTVATELREFCESHGQIARYIFDQEGKINDGKSEGYPLVYVEPVPSIMQKGSNTFSLSIAVMDLALEDLSDIESVYSNAHAIISDIRAYFANNKGVDYDLGDEVTLEPIRYDQNDSLNGWTVTIDFQTAADASGCLYPTN